MPNFHFRRHTRTYLNIFLPRLIHLFQSVLFVVSKTRDSQAVMFDPQFRLSPDAMDNSSTQDEMSSNGFWQQMSLDRLLEHHDLTPAQPISLNDASTKDVWSNSSGQFNDLFNNYPRQYQQQNQPLDISSFISSSPPQQLPAFQQSKQQQQQQHFPLPPVDNHIFEPQQDPQPGFFDPYAAENNRVSMRRDAARQQQPYAYSNRPRQGMNMSASQRAPPVLQIPTDDPYRQQQKYYQQQSSGSRYKQNPSPAYVACLNHGINYNGVSGPPILLPPSF